MVLYTEMITLCPNATVYKSIKCVNGFKDPQNPCRFRTRTVFSRWSILFVELLYKRHASIRIKKTYAE